jgi:hypothetical protein
MDLVIGTTLLGDAFRLITTAMVMLALIGFWYLVESKIGNV